MNPFSDEWEVIWRPTWPGLGPCIITSGNHTMTRIKNLWTCTACFAFWDEKDQDALADWHIHAMKLTQLVPRKN